MIGILNRTTARYLARKVSMTLGPEWKPITWSYHGVWNASAVCRTRFGNIEVRIFAESEVHTWYSAQVTRGANALSYMENAATPRGAVAKVCRRMRRDARNLVEIADSVTHP